MAEATSLLRPGACVYAPGQGAESSLLISALACDPSRSAGVTFVGVWVPGVNRFDYAGVHEEARGLAFFVPPEFHDSFMARRLEFRPMPYTAIYSWLSNDRCIDVAFLHVSPPDGAGMCSLGVAADFAPAVWTGAKVRVGLVNREMPRTRSPCIPFGALHHVVDADSALLEYRHAAPDPLAAQAASHVAALVSDGDTLQFGIGAIPSAVLPHLKDRRNLRCHSGMITEGVLDLIDAGAVSTDAGAVTTGVALGSRDFYARLGTEPSVSFHPVPVTHGLDELRRLRQFTAINSALAVDLFGQLNVESIKGRQVSGVGGITDFMRGAASAPGGRAIVALPSRTPGGIPRIVAAHPRGTAIACARSESFILVTEQGMADLRGLALDARAEAIIAIAHPADHEDLTRQWRELRSML